jgi:hypothetical protein
VARQEVTVGQESDVMNPADVGRSRVCQLAPPFIVVNTTGVAGPGSEVKEKMASPPRVPGARQWLALEQVSGAVKVAWAGSAAVVFQT